MTQQNQTDSNWAHFIAKHKTAFAIFIITAILAFAGAIYVSVWVIGNLQAINFVPSTLSLWSIENMWALMWHLIFWELVLIGIPAAVGAAIGWQWWKRLPQEEKHLSSGNKHSSSRAGGAIGPLLGIAFVIKVYFDGNWATPIASWNVDYVVGSMITILLWAAAIFAIPAVAGFAYWIHSRTKKANPPQENSTNQPPT